MCRAFASGGGEEQHIMILDLSIGDEKGKHTDVD